MISAKVLWIFYLKFCWKTCDLDCELFNKGWNFINEQIFQKLIFSELLAGKAAFLDHVLPDLTRSCVTWINSFYSDGTLNSRCTKQIFRFLTVPSVKQHSCIFTADTLQAPSPVRGQIPTYIVRNLRPTPFGSPRNFSDEIHKVCQAEKAQTNRPWVQ